MAEPLTVLVVGATGNQGGAVARLLLNRGHRVLALTRHPESPAAVSLGEAGAELVTGDLEDRDSLKKAAQGADAVFAMATPYEAGVEAETRHGENILAAAQDAGVAHLVYSSVGNADTSTGIPHFESKYEIEQQIQASSLPHTIIAPVYFMENLFAPWTLPGLKEGKLAMALPADRPLQQVSVPDIAEFAVLALTNRDRFRGKRIDLAGDEISGVQAAQTLSQVSGREIEYVEIPADQRAAMGEDFKRMLDWFDETGYSVDIDRLRSEYAEVQWTTYEQWAKAQDWSVLDH